jgi:histone acetyltransferase 1
LAITLVKRSPSGPISYATFHPSFTYPIFDDERIFGYQGLKINVRYRVDDMRPHLKVSYQKRFAAIGETEPADITAILRNHLPQGMDESTTLFR